MARQIVGEIFLNVKPLDGGVAPGVQRIIDTASQQAADIPITADTEQAQQAVAQLSGAIEEDLGTAWISATAQAATFTAAVLGLRAAAEQALNKLAGIFDQLAQAQAGFTAILGSEQSGQKLLDDIREFARVSPFVTQELVNYSQQLLGVGQSAESIVPLLENTGDLIASVGGDTQNISRVLFTLTQIRSIGRLVGQDAIQLQSSLIPITKLLADFLGVTTQEVKKLQEQGAISADTVFAAINNAGSKVSGAMATATRNISGAQSVLSDSIEILLQDSEFLRNVFDDIVQGILAFSDALAEPTIQNNIESIFDSLQRLYEGLEPLLEGFSETAAAGAINALKLTASALEILASAVDSIPTEALELIGRSLAILLALKAPIALLNYGRALRNITEAIRPTNLAGNLATVQQRITGTGEAAAVADPRVAAYNARIQRLGTVVSVAAVGAGLLIQNLDESNKSLQTIGTTLQGAGIGAQLGSAFGPQGIAVGAAAGGGIAAITAFVTNAREEAERRAEELAETGQKAAEKFLEGFNLANPAGFTTTQTFTDFFTGLEEQFGNLGDQTAEVAALEERIAALAEERNRLLADTTSASAESAFAVAGFKQEEIDEAVADLERVRAALDVNRASINSLLTEGAGADAIEEVRSKLAALANESPEFKQAMDDLFGVETGEGFGAIFNLKEAVPALFDVGIATGQASALTADGLTTIITGLGDVGLTLDTLLSSEIPDLVSALSNDMPSAAKETEIALREVKTAFDEAKKGMEEFFNSFQLRTDAAKRFQEESKGIQKALEDLNDTGNGLDFAEQLLKNVQSISTAAATVYDDQAQGIASGLSFASAALDELQSDLRLTDDEFREFLDTVGLLELFLSSQDVEQGFVGSIIRLSNETGIAEGELRELLNLQEDLARSTELTVTADTIDALTKLSTIRDTIANLPVEEQNAEVQRLIQQIEDVIGLAGAVRITGGISGGGGGPEGSPLQPGDLARLDATVGAQLRAAEEEAKRLAEQQQKEAERAARDLQREQEAAAREAERIEAERQRYLDSLESAGETVARSIESAAADIRAAAQQWTESIRERTRQERAVPIDRLLRNAAQQADDLSFIDSSLRELQSRGLSEDAINAIGVSGLGDVRQLQRLLGASDTQLQQLSALVGQRDANAEAIARRQQRQETQATIVAAILQAASILDLDLTPQQANALSAQFIINGNSTTADLPPDFVQQLLNIGQIVRT